MMGSSETLPLLSSIYFYWKSVVSLISCSRISLHRKVSKRTFSSEAMLSIQKFTFRSYLFFSKVSRIGVDTIPLSI